MRKIGSEKEIERKKKRNALAVSIFMLAILILGTIGYGFISSPGRDTGTDGEIRDGEIVSVGNRWATNINGQIFQFTNHPGDVSDIEIQTTATLQTYSGRSLYLVSKNAAVLQEIATTVGRYASRVQEACYGPCEENLPEKDCTENLIIWKDNQHNSVYQEDNCIFIEGDITAVDAFIFKILGISGQQ